MKISVYTIIKDESWMLPYFLRHYSTFADRIVIFDEKSTDGSREIIAKYPKAEVREWLGKGLNDEEFTEAVNNFWKEGRARDHWIMWPDVDELLCHGDMRKLLETTEGDVVAAVGYALIQKERPPRERQAYEEVKTGVRQENYDKQIIWRSTLAMSHTIGRHTYPEHGFPKHDGKLAAERVDLYHLHHIGGVQFTIERNSRNFKRAVDKKYAWNYSKDHDKPEQVGSVSWVKKVLSEPLREVVGADILAIKSEAPPAPAAETPPPPKEAPVAAPQPNVGGVSGEKIHLGCGGRVIPGWKNHDMEVDIRRPLPYPSNSASHILAEHVIEHVTPQQAWKFLEECYRVLKPGGVARICFPDLCRMSENMTDEYRAAVKAGGHSDGSKSGAIRAAVFSHGHQGAWTLSLMATIMRAVGLTVRSAEPRKSEDIALVDVDQHWKTVGESVNAVETSVVEGVK
jgi:SAM-dependent methyltransferase